VVQMSSRPSVTGPSKPPVVEGWSESELVGVYNAAPIRYVSRGESILTDADETDSIFVLLDGTIEVVVKLHGQPGRPGIFQRVMSLPLYRNHGDLLTAHVPSSHVRSSRYRRR